MSQNHLRRYAAAVPILHEKIGKPLGRRKRIDTADLRRNAVAAKRGFRERRTNGFIEYKIRRVDIVAERGVEQQTNTDFPCLSAGIDHIKADTGIAERVGGGGSIRAERDL